MSAANASEFGLVTTDASEGVEPAKDTAAAAASERAEPARHVVAAAALGGGLKIPCCVGEFAAADVISLEKN